MLATICVTSGVPMLCIVILSDGACKLHTWRNVRLRETELLRLPWYMIRDHVSLYHQGQVSVRLAHFLYRDIKSCDTKIRATQQTYQRSVANPTTLALRQRRRQVRRSSET